MAVTNISPRVCLARNVTTDESNVVTIADRDRSSKLRDMHGSCNYRGRTWTRLVTRVLRVKFTANSFRTARALYEILIRLALAKKVSRQSRHFNNLQHSCTTFTSTVFTAALLSCLQSIGSSFVYVYSV